MVKVLFRRPCHVPPCLINGEGGSRRDDLKVEYSPACDLKMKKHMVYSQVSTLTSDLKQ